MQTSIRKVSPVEYELVIDATADELAPVVERRLRDQRANISLKGFRKGKVPLSLLKKRFGESLVIDALEDAIRDTFFEKVVEPDEYQVVGLPRLSEFDYRLDGDLHAVMKFSVRPQVEIADLSGETVLRLQHEISDEDIDRAIQSFRMRRVQLHPREEGGIEETDHVTIDMQRLDPTTLTPVIGGRSDNVSFYLDDENLKNAMRTALLGKAVNDTFRVDLPEGDEEEDEPASALLLTPDQAEESTVPKQPFQVYINKVERRELPEIDEAFIREITRDTESDEEGLRAYVRRRLEEQAEEESRELLRDDLIRLVLEKHDFPVPESAVEGMIQLYLKQLRDQYESLPDDFDVEAFKAARRPHAEREVKWQLFREALIEQEGLEVTDEDRRAYFLKMSNGEEALADSLEQYYRSAQGMMDQLDDRILDQKVIDALAARVNLVPASEEDYLKAVREREERLESLKI